MRPATAFAVTIFLAIGTCALPAQVQSLTPRALANGVEMQVQLGELDAVLELQPVSLRAPGFMLLVDDRGVLQAVAPPPPATFRGTIRGRDGSVAASIHDGRVTAVIHTGDATWAIQPQAGAHLVYRNDEVSHAPLQCGCAHQPPPPPPPIGTAAVVTSPFVFEAELALDADLEFYQRNGSSVTATLQAIERLINPVDAVYRRDVQIRHRITTVIVRTSPVYIAPGITGRLAEVRNHWNQNHAAIPRDVVHLFTGVFDPSFVGMANLPSVCNVPMAYAVSSAYQPLHLDNVVLVAHELGHTWDAQHCLSWPCEIMYPLFGVTQTATFTSQETPSMIAYRDAQTCLTVIAAGAFVPYGSGCAGTAGVPQIGSAGNPVFGQTFSVTLGSARANTAAILAIGGSDATWGGVALPWSLAGLGAPGCSLLASPDLTLALSTNALGGTVWSLVVPVIPELFGITLFTQWAVIDPGANALGLVLSNAGAATLGDQ